MEVGRERVTDFARLNQAAWNHLLEKKWVDEPYKRLHCKLTDLVRHSTENQGGARQSQLFGEPLMVGDLASEIWLDMERGIDWDMREYRTVHQNKELQFAGRRFFIIEPPFKMSGSMDCFVRYLKTRQVRAFVRAELLNYPANEERILLASLIQLVGLPFPRGGLPEPVQLQEWLRICRRMEESPGAALAVQGEGRAGFLVAIGFAELGFPSREAIRAVQGVCPTEISSRQEEFILNYKRRKGILMRLKAFCGNCFTF